jgi:hypothetical protein
MLVVSFFFMLLLLSTPPLILGGWLILLLRFGLLGDIIGRTNWLINPQEDSVARSQSWLILTMGIFILLIMLYVSPHLVSSMPQGENLETYIPDQRLPSLGGLALAFLDLPFALMRGPVAPLLSMEAWLVLLSYFGLHYFLHRLKVPTDQVQCLKTTGITVLQFLGVLTSFIGLGWWRDLDSVRRESIGDFLLVLSPTTVLLTFGLVFMLFFSLNKILAVEENTEQHQQIARRMVFVLLSTLILLGLVGGGLSLLIHLNPFRLPSIT